MPEIFTLKPPERNQSRRQSPNVFDNDRYTPMADEYYNDDQPYKNSYPTSGNGTEFYHLKQGGNPSEPFRNQSPFKQSSSPIHNSYSTSGNGPELYHLKIRDDNNYPISDRRPSPAFSSNNRISPMPYQNSTGQGPEMYHIRFDNETRQNSPPINKIKFNDQPTYHDDQDYQPTYRDDQDHQPGKVIVYTISAVDGENILPPPSRISSPPIRQSKKPISYDVIDDNNKYNISTKHRSFPTALQDVPINIPYVPLTQSKASESIQRSLYKYRFGGS